MTVADKPHFEFEPGERQALPAALQTWRPQLSRLVIAIDGPAGSGKSTTARAVAKRLGLRHLDTGALYRAVTLAAMRRGTALDDGAGLAQVANGSRIRVETGPTTRVWLANEDVTLQVRAPEVAANVSRVAAHADVREVMLERQRHLARRGGVVMDGRDIGTVVLPQADLKVFLTADVKARAERRQLEETARGGGRHLDEVEREIQARDLLDSTRESAPLAAAEDAVFLDTSHLDIETQVQAVLALAVRAVQRAAQGGLGFVDPAAWVQPGYRPFRHLRFRLAHAFTRAAFTVLAGARRHLHPATRLRGSVLVACNHISLLDPPAVATSLPFETCFVAKEELFRNRWFGGLVRALNARPIRRGKADFAALDRAVQDLQQGMSVMMFPEGTRQVPGRLGVARWGFGYVALRAGRPVVPAFVRGTDELRPRGLRRGPLEIWVGEPVDVRGLSGATRAHYERVGALVMDRIEALMLRSAGRTPLPGLDLERYRGAPNETLGSH